MKTKLKTITLESISKKIQTKRNEKLDSLNFSFSKLQLSDYDIRESRDISKLTEDLVRDGQLQVITVSVCNGISTIVNGRTRYLAMKEINGNEETKDLFSTVNVEVYNDLSELEQDYLNAQINVSQNPLTANEKVNFVKKYLNVLDPKALGKALGIAKEMLSNYIETASTDDVVQKAFSPQSEGYGRSDVKVEELGRTAKAYKSESGGVAIDVTTHVEMGKALAALDYTRDKKRKIVPIIAKKTAKLQQNEKIVAKFTPKEIVAIAVKETSLTNPNGGSGDKLPKNSSEKYKTVDSLLKKTYDFAVILYAESLYRTDSKGNQIESETKRIIDKVNEIIVIGNETEKLLDIEEYALEQGKKFKFYNDEVIDAIQILKDDDRNGFVYVNGAMLYAQRPEFLNYLKKKYPKSTVAMVVIDLLFGKSQAYAGVRETELITVYAGAENFDEVIDIYKKSVKFLKIRQFATLPQKKYIIYV